MSSAQRPGLTDHQDWGEASPLVTSGFTPDLSQYVSQRGPKSSPEGRR